MDRRNFFSKGAKVALGTTLISGLKLDGAEALEDTSEVIAEISDNHGHELNLTLANLVTVLRELQPENKIQTLSIQGQSHPHSINLEFNDVLDILLGKEKTLDSSSDFNHSHKVRLKLRVEE